VERQKKKFINYCNYNQKPFHSLIQTVKEVGGVACLCRTHILMAHVQIHTRHTHMQMYEQGLTCWHTWWQSQKQHKYTSHTVVCSIISFFILFSFSEPHFLHHYEWCG